jgi:hypothetical protein
MILGQPRLHRDHHRLVTFYGKPDVQLYLIGLEAA